MNRILLRFFLITAFLLHFHPAAAVSPRPVEAENGMVVSAHEWASRAGVEMMKRGGNAVDAAVAAAFTAGVVEPYSAGIGGGGFMLVYLAGRDETIVIDYRETAPLLARRDMYLDKDGEIIEGLSLAGHLAVGVPGTVAGLALALEEYGNLPLEVVLEPAIDAAREGFPADPVFRDKSRLMKPLLSAREATAKIFLNNGEVYAPGELVKQEDLGQTLESIASQGPDAFYTGEIADAIVEDMAANDGLIQAEDLANYEPRIRKPVRGGYRGYEIVTMPPPSSGGVHLIQMLNILEGYDLRASGRGSSETIHRMVEAMRRAFADRAEFLGDPAFVDVPVDWLTSKAYAAELRRSIGENASPSAEIRPGTPAAGAESPSTTHISVVDKDGNAVSMTQTINYSFGSGVVVPGTGILLNNEMDDFSAKPGVPNVYGLVGNEANAIAAGKIPLSSMTPTLVFRDGDLFMVIGSPGGPRIITTVLQAIVNVIDYDLTIQEAIDAPRFHHQWFPDTVFLEPGAVPVDVIQNLRAKDHTPTIGDSTWSNAMGIVIDPETRKRLGATDSRGVGKAAGY